MQRKAYEWKERGELVEVPFTGAGKALAFAHDLKAWRDGSALIPTNRSDYEPLKLSFSVGIRIDRVPDYVTELAQFGLLPPQPESGYSGVILPEFQIVVVAALWISASPAIDEAAVGLWSGGEQSLVHPLESGNTIKVLYKSARERYDRDDVLSHRVFEFVIPEDYIRTDITEKLRATYRERFRVDPDDLPEGEEPPPNPADTWNGAWTLQYAVGAHLELRGGVSYYSEGAT